MAQPPPNRLPMMMSLETVAEELAITVRTVRAFVASGLLPAHRIGPRLLRVRRDDVENLIGERIPSAADWASPRGGKGRTSKRSA